MTECIHDLDPATCSLCRTPRRSPARSSFSPLRGIPTTITARFDSRCPACGDPIYEGDKIALNDGVWVHVDCYS